MTTEKALAFFCLLLFTSCNDDAQLSKANACLIPNGEMIGILAGTALVGSAEHYREERPVRTLSYNAFSIQAHEVTNRQFAAFVSATGYVTQAERPPPHVPGASAAASLPGAAVFKPPTASHPSWWHWVPGANWRAPEGPGSSIDGLELHPVVQVTLEDAQTYATWAGARLPTADEWEVAARGGLDHAPYAWGDTDIETAPARANTWQGFFPLQNTAQDGFTKTAPVGCFGANGFGLYDMIGNVWELTRTLTATGETVIKGGSYLCAPNYCQRYRPAAWQTQDIGLSTNHIGFRVITYGNKDDLLRAQR